MGRGPLLVPHRKGNVMESMRTNLENEDSAKTKLSSADQKVKTQIDRVTLNKEESDKINAWLKQIKDSSKGFLDLTRSDLVNFLIKSHHEELFKKRN